MRSSIKGSCIYIHCTNNVTRVPYREERWGEPPCLLALITIGQKELSCVGVDELLQIGALIISNLIRRRFGIIILKSSCFMSEKNRAGAPEDGCIVSTNVHTSALVHVVAICHVSNTRLIVSLALSAV